jgi:hypothetical protein
MKNMVFAVLLAGGVAAGFVVGRMCAGGACETNAPGETNAPSAAVASSDDALDKARKRIAALEAELAEARNDTRRVRKLVARAENAVEKALKEGEKEKEGGEESYSFSVGTNVDVVAEMKRQLPEEAFVAATNALERMKVANAERRKGRREYLASLDVSGLSKKERENHKRFMELFDRREKAMSKMKGLIPDEKTVNELIQIEMEMRPLAKQERKALLGGVTRELGYTGEDGAIVMETLEGIFDCTGSDGLGGLGDLMDGAEVQPGVSIETHVIGL